MSLQKSLVLCMLGAGFCIGSSLNSTGRICKPLPDSPNWPSPNQWVSLNFSLEGRLESTVVPGAVCHPTEPTFNSSRCSYVASQWTNSSFHATNPWTVDYNDDTCPPNATELCSTKGYPAYAVKAIDAFDAQQAVNFARTTGVRLVIKGTGHDYLGRSTGPGTLELWTHNLRGVEFSRNDSYAVRQGGIGRAKIYAGMRWGEVYREASKHNMTVIGGADPNVGVGGWILHGGHGPVTSVYGMGADQVLEMEVVTADGRLRVVNETHDADLFWALRGGGASTFAVLISMVVKAYPSLPGTAYTGTFNTTANSDTFWSLAAHLSSRMPAFSDAGGMGYYYMYPYNGNNSKERSGGIFVSFLFPNKRPDQAGKVMDALTRSLTDATWALDSVYSEGHYQYFPDFMTYWLDNKPGVVGHNVRLGSWLLGDGLTKDIETVKASLRTATDLTYGSIGHVVAGRGVKNARIPSGSNSVLPAWRHAYVHLVAIRRWSDMGETRKETVTDDVRNNVMPALRKIQPDSGAYINEADPSNPDWQEDYFGETYSQLLDIKKRWDPEGVFYCRPCVGHELWEIVDGPNDQPQSEWGIGRTGGRFCRRQSRIS